MHFFLFISTLCYATVTTGLFAQGEGLMLTLGEVTSEQSDKLSMVTLKLSQPPPWKKIELEDHGNFIQFSLPNTVVTDSGSFVVSQIPWIKTIGIFQATPQTGMVRLFLSEDGASIKKHLESEIVGNRILLTVSHQALLGKNVAAPTLSVIAQPKIEISQSPDTMPSLSEPLKKMTWGLLSVLGLLFVVLTLGRLIRTHRMSKLNGSNLKMYMIADLPLAPKQKLSLIQIGNEKFLFSVSPDGIHLLTQLETGSFLQEKVRDSKRQEFLSQPQMRHQDPDVLSPIKRTPSAAVKQEMQQREREPAVTTSQQKTSSVSYTVDDNGISNNNKKDPSLDDISRLLKEKLRAFPKL